MSSSKYLLVAGARPNFMKIAPIHKAFSSLRNSHFFADLLFVHTGQHYSQSMSDDFFRDLGLHQPFPEELNRLLAARMTTLHFAATPGAASNLKSEGVPLERIFVTGNTGIDAVLYVRDGLDNGRYVPSTWRDGLNEGCKLIVVTAHRRESFGSGFEGICCALTQIASRDDVRIVFPVHPNPNVQGPVTSYLGSHPRIRLIPPLNYVPFVDLMRQAYLLLTDSGGIQEEGPSLGKPILVLREKTERPEAVLAGTVKLVGTNTMRIVSETALLLDSSKAYAQMTRVHNPYGDGHACERIERALRPFLGGAFAESEQVQAGALSVG